MRKSISVESLSSYWRAAANWEHRSAYYSTNSKINDHLFFLLASLPSCPSWLVSPVHCLALPAWKTVSFQAHICYPPAEKKFIHHPHNTWRLMNYADHIPFSWVLSSSFQPLPVAGPDHPIWLKPTLVSVQPPLTVVSMTASWLQYVH